MSVFQRGVNGGDEERKREERQTKTVVMSLRRSPNEVSNHLLCVRGEGLILSISVSAREEIERRDRGKRSREEIEGRDREREERPRWQSP